MGRELWAELSAAISLTDLHFCDNPDVQHPTAVLVRCHLWSMAHDRPDSWAVDPTNWDRSCRPATLPSQSTLCRRLRSAEFEEFMGRLADRLRHLPRMAGLFKRMDAKALPVAAHSTDPDAGWGRGAGQMSNGYKFHVIWAGGAMPLLWRVAPLDVSEQEMARRMLRDLAGHGGGHVVADSSYDINLLYGTAAGVGPPTDRPTQTTGRGAGPPPAPRRPVAGRRVARGPDGRGDDRPGIASRPASDRTRLRQPLLVRRRVVDRPPVVGPPPPPGEPLGPRQTLDQRRPHPDQRTT